MLPSDFLNRQYPSPVHIDAPEQVRPKQQQNNSEMIYEVMFKRNVRYFTLGPYSSTNNLLQTSTNPDMAATWSRLRPI